MAAGSGSAALLPPGKSLAVCRRTAPSFAIITPLDALLAMFGGGGIIERGNRLIAAIGAEDPAAAIGAQLQRWAESRFAVLADAGPRPVSNFKDLHKLSALYAGADYVLDVQTVNWSIVYRASLTRYRVLYSVHMRLVDTRRAAIVAAADCERHGDDDASPPTYGQLVGDGGALLKSWLQRESQECGAEFEADLSRASR